MVSVEVEDSFCRGCVVVWSSVSDEAGAEVVDGGSVGAFADDGASLGIDSEALFSVLGLDAVSLASAAARSASFADGSFNDDSSDPVLSGKTGIVCDRGDFGNGTSLLPGSRLPSSFMDAESESLLFRRSIWLHLFLLLPLLDRLILPLRDKAIESSLVRGTASCLPRSSSGFSTTLARVVVDGDAIGGGDVADARLSCHSLRRSLAHELQELKYAPAFWLTTPTDAWACVRSTDGGLRENHDDGLVSEAADEGTRGEVGVGGTEVSIDNRFPDWPAFSSFFFR